MQYITENLKALARRLHLDAAGATAVEYGVMVALIVAVIIGAVYGIGQSTNNAFTDVDNCLANASTGSC